MRLGWSGDSKGLRFSVQDSASALLCVLGIRAWYMSISTDRSKQIAVHTRSDQITRLIPLRHFT